MRTVRCSGHLSCHAWLPSAMHHLLPPSSFTTHVPPLPHMPPLHYAHPTSLYMPPPLRHTPHMPPSSFHHARPLHHTRPPPHHTHTPVVRQTLVKTLPFRNYCCGRQWMQPISLACIVTIYTVVILYLTATYLFIGLKTVKHFNNVFMVQSSHDIYFSSQVF